MARKARLHVRTGQGRPPDCTPGRQCHLAADARSRQGNRKRPGAPYKESVEPKVGRKDRQSCCVFTSNFPRTLTIRFWQRFRTSQGPAPSVRIEKKHSCVLLTPLSRRSCCLLYTSPSPRDGLLSRMPSS